ncbi:hypothetical protein JCM15519_37870 [Fundidesulfovibrio butyratiphilus]
MKRKTATQISMKAVVIVFCIANLLFAIHLKTQRDHVLRKKAHGVVHRTSSDAEKAIKLTEFVYNLRADSIGNNSLAYNIDHFGLSAALYGILPLNLIPADIMLTQGIVYTGPCGAKSRLLHSLFSLSGLESRMISLHDANGVPTHTLVEVLLDGVYTPVDPTYNLYIVNDRGNFVDTSDIYSAKDIKIISSIRVATKEYTDEFRYVTHFSVKDAVISILRIADIIEDDYSNIKAIQKHIDNILPKALLGADFDEFALYNDTRMLYLALSTGILALAVLYFFRRNIASFLSRHKRKPQ